MFISTNGPEVISETTGAETVVIHLGTGLYFSLKQAASELWSHFAQGIDETRLLNAHFAGDSNRSLANEIKHYLEWLDDNALIARADRGPTQHGSNQTGPLILQSDQFRFDAYDDMQELLGLDPIHDADSQEGWPAPKPSGEGS